MSEVVALTACHFVSSGVCKYFRLARKVHNKNTGDKLIMNFPHNKLTKYSYFRISETLAGQQSDSLSNFQVVTREQAQSNISFPFLFNWLSAKSSGVVVSYMCCCIIFTSPLENTTLIRNTELSLVIYNLATEAEKCKKYCKHRPPQPRPKQLFTERSRSLRAWDIIGLPNSPFQLQEQ